MPAEERERVEENKVNKFVYEKSTCVRCTM